MSRISLLFVFLGCLYSASAQDTLNVRKIIPAFYLDYGKLAGSLDQNNLRLEGGAEIILNDKWQFVGELGSWNLKPEAAIENGFYQVQGTYQRFGFGFLPRIAPESRLGFGVRYATANFSEKGYYLISSELQPDVQEDFNRNDQSATWYEVVVNSDKELNKWLAAGFNFRMRFGLIYDEHSPIDVVTIPGYGRAQDKIVPAFNLFLKVTF